MKKTASLLLAGALTLGLLTGCAGGSTDKNAIKVGAFYRCFFLFGP